MLAGQPHVPAEVSRERGGRPLRRGEHGPQGFGLHQPVGQTAGLLPVSRGQLAPGFLGLRILMLAWPKTRPARFAAFGFLFVPTACTLDPYSVPVQYIESIGHYVVLQARHSAAPCREGYRSSSRQAVRLPASLQPTPRSPYNLVMKTQQLLIDEIQRQPERVELEVLHFLAGFSSASEPMRRGRMCCRICAVRTGNTEHSRWLRIRDKVKGSMATRTLTPGAAVAIWGRVMHFDESLSPTAAQGC